MQYFSINEKEYYSCLKSFPKKDRETLRMVYLLVTENVRKIMKIIIIFLLQY